jgi:hypothetical protein
MHGGPTNTRQKCLIDISASTTVSSAVLIGGAKAIALEFPSAWTGASPAVTFQGAHRVTDTFKAITDDAGAAIDCDVQTDGMVVLTADLVEHALRPFNYLKVVAGAAQGADREVNIHCGY